MPVRPARYADLSAVSVIYAAAFYDDSLNVALMPHRDEYPLDNLRAWSHRLVENWWDYTRSFIVSYEDKDGHEVLTGIAEWTREGDGWEKLWGIKGWWDPRLLMLPLVKVYHRIHRTVFRNRASVRPTPSEPKPLTFWTWQAAVIPFMIKYLDPPSPWTTQKAIEPSTESDTSSSTSTPPQWTFHPAFWELSTLGVLPRCHGLGHGRALVAWGVNLSRQQNLPALVIAAEGKERFYQRCGFTNLVGNATEGDGNPLAKMGIAGGAILWTEPVPSEKKEN